MTSSCPAHESKKFQSTFRVVTAMALLWIGPILACGSFEPRPTPTPPLVVSVQDDTPQQEPALPTSMPTAPPAPAPTATATLSNGQTTPESQELSSSEAPVPSASLTIGEPARIIASGGLNIRQEPNTGAPIVVSLGSGQLVSVIGGPVATGGYVWWELDDGQGNVGWAVEGQGDEEWIISQIGEPQPANRSPRVGDRVVVTLDGQLSVRAGPGTNAAIVKRVNTGDQFLVVAGPQAANSYIWFQIRSDDRQVEGWAADGRDGERWLSPLE